MQMNFLTNNPGHSSWGDILNTKLDQSIFTFINTGTRKEIYITQPKHTRIIYNVQKILSQTFLAQIVAKEKVTDFVCVCVCVKSYDILSTTQKFCPRDFIWMVTTQILVLRWCIYSHHYCLGLGVEGSMGTPLWFR